MCVKLSSIRVFSSSPVHQLLVVDRSQWDPSARDPIYSDWSVDGRPVPGAVPWE